MSNSLIGSWIDFIGVDIITIKERKYSKIRHVRRLKKCYTRKLKNTYMALSVLLAIPPVTVMTQIKDLCPSVLPRR